MPPARSGLAGFGENHPRHAPVFSPKTLPVEAVRILAPEIGNGMFHLLIANDHESKGMYRKTVPYDKLKLDLFYIENYSLWMDLKLILMTVKTVLKKDSTEGVDTDQTTGLKEHTEGNEEVERKIQEYTSREESRHE